MAQPQIMEMKIPPDITSVVKTDAKNMLTLYIAKNDKLYYRVGADTTFKPIAFSDLRNFAVARNAEKGNALILSLKLDPEANYGRMVAVMDELNKAETILTVRYKKENVENGERKRRFSIQPLDSVEQYRLEQL